MLSESGNPICPSCHGDGLDHTLRNRNVTLTKRGATPAHDFRRRGDMKRKTTKATRIAIPDDATCDGCRWSCGRFTSGSIENVRCGWEPGTVQCRHADWAPCHEWSPRVCGDGVPR